MNGEAVKWRVEAISTRLDQALVERGLVATRSRARDLIRRGLVRIAGSPCTKAAQPVEGSVTIEVDPSSAEFVSRGAEKLLAALDAFGLSPAGRAALDIGASTGGFTEVLLKRGARQVYAVDVGRDQLHPRLRQDARVISGEGLDARALTRDIIPEPVGAIVADVSFISLIKAIGPAMALAAPGAWMIVLVKPQFEVGRERVAKGGIVRDEAARREAVATVEVWLAARPGWRVIGSIPSPIQGGSGNQEFLTAAIFDG